MAFDPRVNVLPFAVAGSLLATQDLASQVLEGVEGADPVQVAEETLVLVAVATARAAEFSIDGPGAEAVSAGLMELPHTYHDYLMGTAISEGMDTGALDEDVYRRLDRIQEFYSVHLPAGAYPGRRVLTDKMGLWMGRMSPPQLPESPQERLERLGLVDVLVRHLKLIKVQAQVRE